MLSSNDFASHSIFFNLVPICKDIPSLIFFIKNKVIQFKLLYLNKPYDYLFKIKCIHANLTRYNYY